MMHFIQATCPLINNYPPFFPYTARGANESGRNRGQSVNIDNV